METLLESAASKTEIANIEHIYKSPPGSRQLSSMSGIEFGSRDDQEAYLKKLSEPNSMPKSANNKESIVQKTKIDSQLKQNASLARVCDFIKKDPRNKKQSWESFETRIWD